MSELFTEKILTAFSFLSLWAPQPEVKETQDIPTTCYRLVQRWPRTQLSWLLEEETPAWQKRSDGETSDGHKLNHFTLLFVSAVNMHMHSTFQFHYQKEAKRISLPGPYSSSTPTTSFTEEETKAQEGTEPPLRSPTGMRTRMVSPAMRIIISDIFSQPTIASILGHQHKKKKRTERPIAPAPPPMAPSLIPPPTRYMCASLLPHCYLHLSHLHPHFSHPVVNKSDHRMWVWRAGLGHIHLCISGVCHSDSVISQ